MAYEFIASGITPAKPLASYFSGLQAGTEMRQNEEINKVNIESAKARNAMAGIELKKASKQVAAEEQWSALPRAEDGSIDPEAEAQFKTAFPEYWDTRKKAEVEQLRGQIGLAAEQFTMASTLFGKAKSPEDIAAAQKFAKDNFGMDIEYDPAVFGTVQRYSSELAQKSAMIQEDIAAAAAAGDYATVKNLQAALTAESTLAQLEVQKAQAAIARDQAAAAASRANAGKYAAQADKARAESTAASATGGPRDPVNLRAAEARQKELDSLISQLPEAEKAVAGEALGTGNQVQRAATRVANTVLTLFGDSGIKATAAEFADAQTLRRFKKTLTAAYVQNPKFPVAEQQVVAKLLQEIDPDKVGTSKGTAMVPFLEMVTFLKNQREKEAAFLENREPVVYERPRLGTTADPVVIPGGLDAAGMKQYLKQNGAKPGMIVEWPDGTVSELKAKK